MEERCFSIDRRLVPIKMHYLLYMAALACVLPFRTVFAKQLGISATAVGVIFCAVPFLKTFTNPFFGFLLDYFKRFRLILSIIMIFLVLSNITLVFIPPRSFTLQNKTRPVEKDFRTNLSYTNDSLPSSCHPKVTLNIEYSLSEQLIDETNSFICDMQCSKSKKNNPKNSMGNQSQCHIQMHSELKILAHVSNCDIDIDIEKGQLGIYHLGTEHLVIFEVNNTLTRKKSSTISSSNNCPSERTKRIPVLSQNTPNTEMKLNDINKSKINIEDIFEFSEENEEKKMTENLDDSAKKYFVKNEYIINFYTKKLCFDFCSQEFDCQAVKCSLDVRRIVTNPEQYAFEENEYLSAQFWGVFMLTTISSATISALMFSMDAVCYELLQERKDKYGHQRLWGTIGWGLGALIGGCLNQIVSNSSGQINYAPSFYLLGVLALIDLIPIYHLKVTDLKYSSNICKDVCFLLSKIDILYNCFIVYIVGVLSGFIWNYQFWFMEEIGSSQVLLGLSQTFECLFELPCFFVSGWIIKKIGHYHCNSATFLCFGLRYLCFAFMYNPWWTLAAAIFHGPTFGLFYVSMTMYAKDEAPSGTEATVQSLLHLCFEGIGAATGSLLGGFGVDKFGCRMSFVCAATTSFIFLFINIVASGYMVKVKKEQSEKSVSSLRDHTKKTQQCEVIFKA